MRTNSSPSSSGVSPSRPPTQDFDASVAFYRDVLGLEESIRWGDRPGQEFVAGGVTLVVMGTEGFGMDFRPNAAPIALRVDDVDAARAELEERGVTFVTQFDSGVCHQAIFHDPDGNPLILHRRYAPR